VSTDFEESYLYLQKMFILIKFFLNLMFQRTVRQREYNLQFFRPFMTVLKVIIFNVRFGQFHVTRKDS